MTPLCLDVKAAAAAVGVSTWTLRRWIDEGLLPTIKFPQAKYRGIQGRNRRVLISADDLKAFVDKHRSGNLTR